jgi:hypothetical protein
MYETSYSGRVIDMLREMVARNPAHAANILAAVREIDRRLRIYPQFGEPLRDLSIPGAKLWIATVSPLVVHYILVESDDSGRKRQVMVVRPFTALPHTGIV